jgi:hypothetical protein
MLLLLFAGVTETPPEPPPPQLSGGSGRFLPHMDDYVPMVQDARDMQDLQDIVAALFAFERIF